MTSSGGTTAVSGCACSARATSAPMALAMLFGRIMPLDDGDEHLGAALTHHVGTAGSPPGRLRPCPDMGSPGSDGQRFRPAALSGFGVDRFRQELGVRPAPY